MVIHYSSVAATLMLCGYLVCTYIVGGIINVQKLWGPHNISSSFYPSMHNSPLMLTLT